MPLPTKTAGATTSAAKSAAQQAVRTRLEEVIDRAKKTGKKQRFHLDPERMKKLRALLVEKAAEDIKADQEKKAQERRRALTANIGAELHSTVTDAAKLTEICQKYHERIRKLQEEKYDLQVAVRGRDYVLNELTIEVNQLRGKFIRPSLKNVNVSSSVTSNLPQKPTVSRNKASARSFREGLRATKGPGTGQSNDDTWKAEKNKPDWMRQISRKSDFEDISE